MCTVSESEVAGAEGKQRPQDGQVRVDHVPALDAHQDGDASPLLGGHDRVGRRGGRKVSGQPPGFPAYRVDLDERAPHRLRRRQAFRVAPDGEEDPTGVPAAQARDIHLAVVMLLAEVVVLIHHHLRGVAVQVDNHDPLEQPLDPAGLDLGLSGGRGREQQENPDSLCHNGEAQL